MMDNSCLISVIVPVYAAEPYIERCARSLFEQSMQEDIEFIFVNDCSPDQTMTVLKRVMQDYPSRAGQIQIINHSTNRGSVQSRKDGALVAKGQYIICCDHDDWVESDMYEQLYRATDHSLADIVICGFYRYKKEQPCGIYVPANRLESENRFPDLWNAYLWIHLIRKELFLEHYDDFVPCKYCEDVFPLCHFYYHASVIRCLPRPLYHHRDNPCSITKSMDIARSRHLIQSNFNKINSLYHNRRLRKAIHKFLLFLKYSSQDSFSSLWLFYWTFRKSSLYIARDPSISRYNRLKMFLVNNCYLLFISRQILSQ